MINSFKPYSLPPRNGGRVTVIAEGRVNPGEVTSDGKTVVFGQFIEGVGEAVFRYRGGQVEQLNTDGHSSFEVRPNRDGSVVAYNRYSLADASDQTGNWDIARWQDGKIEVVAGTPDDEMSPEIDDSGDVIVYDRESKKARKISIDQWKNGVTTNLTKDEAIDAFPDVSGDGSRTLWRRDLETVWMQDQNGVVKPLPLVGQKQTGPMFNQTGDKVLYTAEDAEGERDLFITNVETAQTTIVANTKGVEEYDAFFSGDGKTVAFTGLDFRKSDDPNPLASDMNVYVWRDGKTEQLTWNDGGLNTRATVSDDGNAITWYWVDRQDTSHRKVLLWERDSNLSEVAGSTSQN